MVFRDDEQIDLIQVGGTFGCDRPQPLVISVPKPDQRVPLDDLETIEDAAPDVSRALERIAAAGGQEDGLLARFEPGGQIGIAAFAEQAAADGGHRDQGRIEVDEQVVRIARLRTLGRLRVPQPFKGGIDLADGQLQAGHRAILQQGSPAPNLGQRHIHLGAGTLVLRFRTETAQPQGARHLDGRAQDAVVDHHDRDGGPGHHVKLVILHLTTCNRRYVQPSVYVQHPNDALFGNAHEHDRLVVLDQGCLADHRLFVHGDQHTDRLAGVSDGIGEVGVQEQISEQLASRICGGHRQVFSQGTDLVRTRV